MIKSESKLGPGWRTICLGPDYAKYMCLDCGITMHTKIYGNRYVANEWIYTCPICGSEDLNKETT